ncbi:histidine phosphatase family protein [uncultured Formosa sp.]|uniref:SixA phosphatase family protein n=1 Tax=uncultured Formosa sp. TaxID=255435 RepID=UPI002611D3EB|nr:phosphoglycerate mutase family protein [uncultured Formosa sp.]
MKKIIVIRHGKSSWNHGVADQFRPLKSIGLINTILVCKNFQKMSDISLKNVFTSPAKRALDTCNIFVDNFFLETHVEVQIVDDLYDFDGLKLLNFIKSLANNLESVFIFGHNNALNNFVNTYGNVYIENVPTSGLVVLEFDIDNWSNLKTGNTKLKLFPKSLK